MKFLFFLFSALLMICTSFSSWGQESKTLDSLLNAYKIQAEDTLKLNTLFLLHNNTSSKSPEQALKYARESMALSKKLNNSKYLGYANHHIGMYHRGQGQIDTAQLYFNSAIKHFKKSKFIDGEVMTTSSLAIIEYGKGSYKNALSLLGKNEILHHSKKVDTAQFATDLNVKSVIYLDQGNYVLGLKYAIEAVKLCEYIGDKRRLPSLLNLIGEIEYLSGDYDKSIEYYMMAEEKLRKADNKRFLAVNFNYMAQSYIALSDFSNAKNVLKESLHFSKQVKAIREEAISYSRLGVIARKEGNFRDALNYLEKSKEINREVKARHSLTDDLVETGIIYNEMGNHQKAIILFNEALAIADSTNSYESLENVYQNRSIAYEALKLPNKAFSDFKKYKALNDTIFKTEKARQIEELRTIYDTEKKEQQIVLQEKEIVVLEQEAKISNLQKWLLGSGLGLSLLAFGFGFYGIRQKMQRNKLEKEKVDTELGFKKKELTTHALLLAKKNEVLENVKQKAKELKTSENGARDYQQLIQTINFAQQDDKNWENFTHYFEQVHKDFNKTVKEKYPEVTKNELRLMALLKMNLSSKEIATILNVSIAGVKKARNRLRKKLGITPEESLETVIISI